jgi:Peptidase A4 family
MTRDGFLKRRMALPVAAAAGLLVAAVLAGASLPAAATTTGATHRASAFISTDKYHPVISVAKPGAAWADSQSSNWFGYNQGILDTDTLTSSISGQWTVPTANQHTAGQPEDSATWVGIGGGCLSSTCTATDPTLIQAGTEQAVSSSGAATYDAWYEFLPLPEIQSTMVVHPGDVIDCSITSTIPALWSISLKDTTDGQSFSQTIPYPSDETTAEWIEETPTLISTSGTSTAALPNLTTTPFTQATVNGASAKLVANQAVQLIDASGNPIGTPSAPLGAAFNDCAWATSCPAP